MIAVLDYGMGNVGSILNMFQRVNVPARLTASRQEIERASKIVLPGVGAFDHGMRNLRSATFYKVLQEQVRDRGIPLLGICLGMQLLARSSEEGTEVGLGWVDARVVRFRPLVTDGLKVPHMGWNLVELRRASALFADMYPEPRFYFVHSYHCVCEDPGDVLATSAYGSQFVAALQHGNVYGVQFHPEKSHKFGMRILENFARL